MKILFVIADFEGCGNYRCILPARVISEQGLAEADYSIVVTEKHIKYYDILIFQRSSSAGIKKVVEALKKQNRPVLYEIDDDLFKIPWCNPAKGYYDNDRKMTSREIISLCDGAIVTTEYLANVMYDDFRVPDVEIIPNYLDRDIWGGIEKKQNERLQLGWAGTATHYEDLILCSDVMKQLAVQYDWGLTFIGYFPKDISGVEDRFTFIPFAEFDKYPQNLANIDIGVAPIVDNIFNKSKSWIKILEYGALSIPCVASKVENYIKAQDSGAGVLLAKNTKQWISSLKKLMIDEGFRNSLAQQGKAWADQRFIQDNAYRWVEYCEKIMKDFTPAKEKYGEEPHPVNIKTKGDFENFKEEVAKNIQYRVGEKEMDNVLEKGWV